MDGVNIITGPSATGGRDMDVNFNAAECIKSATHFGSTTYYNICDNTERVITWGGVDWAICLGLLFLLGMVALGVIGFIIAIVTDSL